MTAVKLQPVSNPAASNPVLDAAFGSADYELVWPRTALIRELTALRAIHNRPTQVERIALVLKEAFLGDLPAEAYRAEFFLRRDEYVNRLLAAAPLLREHASPESYWPARRGERTGGWRRSQDDVRRDFVSLIYELQDAGYLEPEMPTICVDDTQTPQPDHDLVLARRLGRTGLWPLRVDDWNENIFYALVEVFHDLVARPRIWEDHYDDCRHYTELSLDTGRAIYRWRINRILRSGGSPFELAEDGEDVGRLVQRADDARTHLIEAALASPDRSAVARVAHAVALFRGRGATEHDKRSAAIALAGILEERRALIRTEIGKKDEGALFGIANEFAIRHQRRGQQGDYDPAFLDWIVWWYLATIELTDRLLARQGAHPGARTS